MWLVLALSVVGLAMIAALVRGAAEMRRYAELDTPVPVRSYDSGLSGARRPVSRSQRLA